MRLHFDQLYKLLLIQQIADILHQESLISKTSRLTALGSCASLVLLFWTSVARFLYNPVHLLMNTEGRTLGFTIPLSSTLASGEGDTIPLSSTLASGEGDTIPLSSTLASGEGDTISPSSTLASGEGDTISPSSTLASGEGDTISPSSTLASGEGEEQACRHKCADGHGVLHTVH